MLNSCALHAGLKLIAHHTVLVLPIIELAHKLIAITGLLAAIFCASPLKVPGLLSERGQNQPQISTPQNTGLLNDVESAFDA